MLPNGWLASGSWDDTIKLWDLVQKRVVATLKGHSNRVVSLKVLKNGHLVSYSTDNTMKIWNPVLKKSRLLRTIQGHGNASFAVTLFGVLSNDFLVTCSHSSHDTKDKEVLMVHDPTDGKKINSIPTGAKAVSSFLVLSNDQVVIGCINGSIKIFDLNGGETRAIDGAHMLCVYSLFQLSNGNLVSSGWDGAKATIKMWNLADFGLLQTIQTDHKKSIRSIDVSEDEAFLATGSYDNTIQIWPLVDNSYLP